MAAELEILHIRDRAARGAATFADPFLNILSTVMEAERHQEMLAHDVPGPDAPIEDVRRWWLGLEPAMQAHTVTRYGYLLGRIDGIPLEIRDLCNRRRLALEIASLDVELRQLRDRGQAMLPSGRRRRHRARLRGLRSIVDRLAQARTVGEEVLVVDFDTVGAGRAVLAFGNPETADRVATFIPGAAASVADVGRCLRAVDNLRQTIQFLDAASGCSQQTAVIMWIYRTRRCFALSVLGRSMADEAAHRLCRFQHGLRAVRAGASPAYRTVIAHSYGCLVASVAALKFGIDVAAISLNGVAGTRADHAGQLGIPRVYATLKPNDPLTKVGRSRWIHNWQPVAWQFGSKVFDSGPGKRWPLPGGVSLPAHFDYFHTDAVSLINNASIVRGAEPDFTVTG